MLSDSQLLVRSSHNYISLGRFYRTYVNIWSQTAVCSRRSSTLTTNIYGGESHCRPVCLSFRLSHYSLYDKQTELTLEVLGESPALCSSSSPPPAALPTRSEQHFLCSVTRPRVSDMLTKLQLQEFPCNRRSPTETQQHLCSQITHRAELQVVPLLQFLFLKNLNEISRSTDETSRMISSLDA